MDPAGNTVEVAVTDEAGHPLAGAEVWAGGRRYTFPLPERPFVTDERGIAVIPIGGDPQTTNLRLRLSADGHAAEPVDFDRGTPPTEVTITAQQARQVGGTLLDNAGEPVANTQVVVTGTPGENGSAPVIDYVRTDANGNWTATALPEEAEGVTASPRFGSGRRDKSQRSARSIPATAAGVTAVAVTVTAAVAAEAAVALVVVVVRVVAAVGVAAVVRGAGVVAASITGTMVAVGVAVAFVVAGAA